MVEEQKIRALLFCLIEDFGQRRKRDQDPVRLCSRVADLQTAVVPLFGQG